MQAVESCLSPSQFDINVFGIRYGILKKAIKGDIWTRKSRVVWKAKMDLPDRVDRRLPFGDEEYDYFEADTRDEAILLAFEEFVRSGSLTLTEYAKIAMELFEQDITADILAAI